MNPTQVAQNRTARLVTEATTPVYSTSTPTREAGEQALVAKAQDMACTNEFCHVCGRCTDHFAEHSDAQLLAWANSPLGRRMMIFV